MCKPNKTILPSAGRFLKMLPAAVSTVVLGLLLALPTGRASAQPCALCPAQATGTAGAAGLNIHVIRIINGVPMDFTVSQGTVGACETLLLVSQATYNPDGGRDTLTGAQKIAAGNAGGQGLLTLPNGTVTNVTPADMATTVVGPTANGSFGGAPFTACGAIAGATSITDSKQMQIVSYTLTPTDINVNHGASFSFIWTNATPMLPNANNTCTLHNAGGFSPQSVNIAPPPTCSIAPATTNICQGGSATFTFTGTLAPNGFRPSVTYCWQKGCPGAGACLSTSASLTINNAQPSDAGCYTVTATDTFGCPTNCQANLTVSPAPTCSFPVAAVCTGTTNCYTSTVLPAGGTVTHHWSITAGTGTIRGANNTATVCVEAGAGASFTLHDDITRDGCPGSCQNTVPINPNPTCSFPVATVCQGTLNCYTSTVLPAGGTVTHHWSVVSGTGIISGTNNGPTVCVRAGTGASFLLRDDITREGCPGSCENTVPIMRCMPNIKVYKQVVCLDCSGACQPFNTDLNTQKSAIGTSAIDADGHEHCSAFCYRITVTNTSDANIELRNLVITDINFPGAVPVDLSSCHFPTTLGANGTATDHASCILSAVTLCDSTTNVVTATAEGILLPSQDSVGTTNAMDTNRVTIVPFNISCTKEVSLDQVNWTSDGNCLTVPAGVNTVYYRVSVTNESDLPLTAIITDANLGCPGITVNIAPRDHVTTNLCSGLGVSQTCPPSPSNNTANVSAEVNTALTNICACTTDHIPVRDTTSCGACTKCTVIEQVFCRVTGGGRQDYNDPRADTIEVCPPDSRYVTHGGQVGAPYGNGTTNCVNQQPCNNVLNQALIVDNIIGNVCIHGRWTHVRHVKGGLEGNFHARFFDTLDCSCLAVDLNSCGLYSPGISTNNTCNPGDRIAGPEPRRAPANKIVFTGVGDWADPNGRRTPRSVLFRVDIEDRSEPGGYKPGGAKPPADRYRIRIWVLTPAECAELHGGGPDAGLLHFRSAIAACYGIHLRDGVQSQFLPNNCGTAGTMFFGGCGEPAGCSVRLPDIDDGGELKNGNHQIHPTIKPCDPTNPQGPGLANSGSDCSN